MECCCSSVYDGRNSIDIGDGILLQCPTSHGKVLDDGKTEDRRHALPRQDVRLVLERRVHGPRNDLGPRGTEAHL